MKKLKIDILEYLESFDFSFTQENSQGFIKTNCPVCDGRNKVYILTNPERYKANEGNDKKFEKGFTKCFKGCINGGFNKFIEFNEGIDPKEAFKKAFSYSKQNGKKGKNNKLSYGATESQAHSPIKKELPPVIPVTLPVLAKKLTINSNTKEQIEARDYLINKRGIDLLDIEKMEAYVLELDGKSAMEAVAAHFKIQVNDLSHAYRKIKDNFSRYKINNFNDLSSDLVTRVESELELPTGIYASCKELYNTYLHRDRILLTIKYKRHTVGYVSRTFRNSSSATGPKTLNSSGPLQSYYLWNFHNLAKSPPETLIICEGIFDAYACGIDRAIAILGLSSGKEDRTLLISKILKPREVIIYLDPGAEDNAIEYASNISGEGFVVKVALPPHLVHKNDQILANLKLYFEITKKDMSGFYKMQKDIKEDRLLIPYCDYLSFKSLEIFFKKFKVSGPQDALKKIKNLKKYETAFERVYEDSKIIYNYFEKDVENVLKLIEPLANLSYVDAGDCSKEENQNIIESATPLGSIVNLKLKKFNKSIL